MKRILLVGKFNEFYRFLNTELAYHFGVQMCTDNLELLMGVLKMSRPDTIVISAAEMDESHGEIFSYIVRQCEGIPVWCIGNRDELDRIREFKQSENIGMIQRPVRMSEIIASIRRGMGMTAEAPLHDSREEKHEKKTILLVDDAAVQLRAMKNILKEKYNVAMATSAKMALEILKKRRMDLILLDYDMPEHDGRETFEMIRAEEEGKDVPVVFVTGVNEKERIIEVLKMKPAGYLVKPVQKEELLETVQQVLMN